MDLLFLSCTGCTHVKNSTQHMPYVGGGCLGLLTGQKNSEDLEDTMGCCFLIRDGNKGRDFKLTLILGSTVGCVLSVLCLGMP